MNGSGNGNTGANGDGNSGKSASQNYIHLRIQQRNGRKTLTTIQGLPDELDQKKLLKAFKKVFLFDILVLIWT